MNLRALFRRPRPSLDRARESQSEDDTGWTRGSLNVNRTLDPERDDLNREQLLRAAFKAYRTNPIAYAVIEQTTSFVLGGGARIVAQDPRVQKVVDSFWNDKDNRMPLRVYAIQTELSLFGEQFIRFFTHPTTGRTLIRQLDPLYVTEIDTDPDDMETPLRYLYNPPGTHLAEGEWIPAEDILHISINKPSSSLRGRSDLAPLILWLNRYALWLQDRVVQNRYRSSLLWDVTVKGADKSEINRLRALNARPPSHGSVLFHNENETWQPVAPTIHAADAQPDGRAIRLMIATGSMLPEHYLGEGGNANRATAAEMGLPAIKRFQRRQELFRAVLSQIVDRVIDEAVRAGRLGPRANRSFTVQFEELSTAPLPHLAAAVKDLTASLATASEAGWITPEEARQLWWRYAAQADESVPQDDGPTR